MKIIEINNVEELKINHPYLDTVQKVYIGDDTYKVYIAQTNQYRHIRVRRLDDLPISSFSDLQSVKNRFLG